MWRQGRGAVNVRKGAMKAREDWRGGMMGR